MKLGQYCSEYELKNNTLSRQIPYYLLFVIYVFFQSYLYLNNALISDEIRFYEVLVGIQNLSNFIFSSNHYQYGPLYWQINKILSMAPNPIMTIRFFYLLINTIQIYLLVKLCDHKIYINRFLYLLLYLSMPIVWWQGKITGVEQLSSFFGVLSLYWILNDGNRHKYAVAGLFFGLAVGTKLTSIFVFPFLLFLLFKNNKKQLIYFLGFVIVGFFLSNICLLSDFKNALASYQHRASGATRTIEKIFFNSDTGWDGVFNGGLINYGLPIFAISIILLSGYKNKFFYSIGWVLSSILAVYATLHSLDLFGWYFNLLILTLSLVCSLNIKDFKIQGKILSTLIVVSFVFNGMLILNFINQKINSINNINSYKQVASFITNQYKNIQFSKILDLTDFNISSTDYNVSPIANAELINIINKKSLSKYYKNPYIDFLAPFRYKGNDLSKECKEIVHAGSILFIVNDKFVQRNVWYENNTSFLNWIESNAVSQCNDVKLIDYRYYMNNHFIYLYAK